MTMTAILVVEGEPVAHTTENRGELYEYLIDNYGPFIEPDAWTGTGVIDTAEELRGCFDCHAGMEQMSFDLQYSNGDLLNAYILISPWYLFEIDDEEQDGAIRQYCHDNDIDIENDNC